MRLYLTLLHDDPRGRWRVHGEGVEVYLDDDGMADLVRQSEWAKGLLVKS